MDLSFVFSCLSSGYCHCISGSSGWGGFTTGSVGSALKWVGGIIDLFLTWCLRSAKFMGLETYDAVYLMENKMHDYPDSKKHEDNASARQTSGF